jgi:hypothetical protein
MQAAASAAFPAVTRFSRTSAYAWLSSSFHFGASGRPERGSVWCEIVAAARATRFPSPAGAGLSIVIILFYIFCYIGL